MPAIKRIGNKVLSTLSKTFYKTKVSDTQTGFKAFKSTIYPKIKWEASDYMVETEIIRNLAKHTIPYTEIKVRTIYEDDYKGTTPLDGLKIAVQMIQGVFG